MGDSATKCVTFDGEEMERLVQGSPVNVNKANRY